MSGGTNICRDRVEDQEAAAEAAAAALAEAVVEDLAEAEVVAADLAVSADPTAPDRPLAAAGITDRAITITTTDITAADVWAG